MTVRQIKTARPRGRPPVRSDAETRHLIHAAARREFLTNGYAATAIGTVAKHAGVSTKTLYRLIPTKAELFKNMVAERIAEFVPQIDGAAIGAAELPAALERLLVAYGRLTLSPETIALQRLVIGESDRFPEIAAAFYDAAILRTSQAMASWLERQCERGLIRLADAQVAAGMLRGMMIMEPQRAAMMRQQPAPTDAEIVARASAATRLFLDGCRLA